MVTIGEIWVSDACNNNHQHNRTINNDLVLGVVDGREGNADTTTIMMVMMTVMMTVMMMLMMTVMVTITRTPTCQKYQPVGLVDAQTR
jgi:hypothetical protein